jgi:DNA-binding CsgD family transcriptional regulator
MPELDRVAIPRIAVPLLTTWGASSTADLVFRALTEHGPQTPAELGRSLGMPANRVHTALDELAAAGAAVPDPPGGRSREGPQWRSRPPRVAVAGLRRRQLARAQARQQITRRLTALAALGAGCQTPPDEAGLVHPLLGVGRVRARLGELVAAGRHEYLAMQPEPAFTREALRAAAPYNRALLERGMSVLTLGVPPLADDVTEAHTVELTSRGMQYRELSELPTKLMLIDRRTAIVPLDPADTGKGALEIAAPTPVRGLVEFFLSQWDQSRPPEERMPLIVDLTPRERAIVASLAAGCTDANAAAQLGLSVRTIAYTVRGLMDRYGVQNRFQLGLVLGSAGVDPRMAAGAGSGGDRPTDPAPDAGLSAG